MSAVHRLLLPLALLVALQAALGHGACVELESDTEAVLNRGFKLGCISCKMRGEVDAVASVHWYFKESGPGTNNSYIYVYDQTGEIKDERFLGRLRWLGSNGTNDHQDGSIYISNVSKSDEGEYLCIFHRVLMYRSYNHSVTANRTIHLTVVPELTRGLASILSEVMMYVSIVGLQLWLVVEMIYCYRKISAAGEEALRESAAEYLAIASESKDNCAAEQAAE